MSDELITHVTLVNSNVLHTCTPLPVVRTGFSVDRGTVNWKKLFQFQVPVRKWPSYFVWHLVRCAKQTKNGNSWRNTTSMVDKKFKKEIISVLLVCVLWYSASSGNNVVTKKLLTQFPYPMTVTMVQLLSITVYSGPFLNFWGVRKFADFSWSFYFKIIVPLALGKFFVSVLTHVSLWKVPVSYAHTGMSLYDHFLLPSEVGANCQHIFLISVKATLPLFSVVLSRIVLGEKQTYKVRQVRRTYVHFSHFKEALVKIHSNIWISFSHQQLFQLFLETKMLDFLIPCILFMIWAGEIVPIRD